MILDLNDRDQACIAFMIDQTARQIPFLKQSVDAVGCAALDALNADINNLLAKLVIVEHLQTPQPTWLEDHQFKNLSTAPAESCVTLPAGIEPHTCPYQVDINGDYDFKCTCGETKMQECADNT